MLFDVIQTITGSQINQKSYRLWKGEVVSLLLLPCLPIDIGTRAFAAFPVPFLLFFPDT